MRMIIVLDLVLHLMVRKNKNKIFYLWMIAIAPAIFQFASELFYPISEIIPTGYLFTGGNIGGVILVALMGWSEDRDNQFSMRWPMNCLTMAMFASVYMMYQVKGTLKRTAQATLHTSSR